MAEGDISLNTVAQIFCPRAAFRQKGWELIAKTALWFI